MVIMSNLQARIKEVKRSGLRLSLVVMALSNNNQRDLWVYVEFCARCLDTRKL